jgi:hypothetical protein
MDQLGLTEEKKNLHRKSHDKVTVLVHERQIFFLSRFVSYCYVTLLPLQ